MGLLPCPFCGNDFLKAETEHPGHDHGGSPPAAYIRCSSCGVSMGVGRLSPPGDKRDFIPERDIIKWQLEEVSNKWNTRASQGEKGDE